MGSTIFGVVYAGNTEYSPELSYTENCQNICNKFRQAMLSELTRAKKPFPTELNNNANIVILWEHNIAKNPESISFPAYESLHMISTSSAVKTIYCYSVEDICKVTSLNQLMAFMVNAKNTNKEVIFVKNPEFNNSSTIVEILATVIKDQEFPMVRNYPRKEFFDSYWDSRNNKKHKLNASIFKKTISEYESSYCYQEHLKIKANENPAILMAGENIENPSEFIAEVSKFAAEAVQRGVLTPEAIMKKYGIKSATEFGYVFNNCIEAMAKPVEVAAPAPAKKKASEGNKGRTAAGNAERDAMIIRWRKQGFTASEINLKLQKKGYATLSYARIYNIAPAYLLNSVAKRKNSSRDEQIIKWRAEGLSHKEINKKLKKQGFAPLSPASISHIVKKADCIETVTPAVAKTSNTKSVNEAINNNIEERNALIVKMRNEGISYDVIIKKLAEAGYGLVSKGHMYGIVSKAKAEMEEK